MRISAFEVVKLVCRWCADASGHATAALLAAVETGDYSAALRQAAERGIMPQHGGQPAAPVTSAVTDQAGQMPGGGGGNDGKSGSGDLRSYFLAIQSRAAAACASGSVAGGGFSESAPLELLLTAAAALYAFLQANLTGCVSESRFAAVQNPLSGEISLSGRDAVHVPAGQPGRVST